MTVTYLDENTVQAAGADADEGYRVKYGRDTIHVVSVYSGTKTASEVICAAAVRKILCEKLDK